MNIYIILEYVELHSKETGKNPLIEELNKF